MKKDFNLNGTTLPKGQKLKIKKGFSQKGDISENVANTLVERGVAEEVKNDPKPTNNRPSKK
jgi:hypothetical protein